MDTTKLTLFSLITKEIALKILTFLFLVCNIQDNKNREKLLRPHRDTKDTVIP